MNITEHPEYMNERWDCTGLFRKDGEWMVEFYDMPSDSIVVMTKDRFDSLYKRPGMLPYGAEDDG